MKFMFKFNGDSFRSGEGATVQEACKEAFGSIYRSNAEVFWKPMSRRKGPISMKERESLYGDAGWSRMPDDAP